MSIAFVKNIPDTHNFHLKLILLFCNKIDSHYVLFYDYVICLLYVSFSKRLFQHYVCQCSLLCSLIHIVVHTIIERLNTRHTL